jgi:membrane associated rhomboid family serine protease
VSQREPFFNVPGVVVGTIVVLAAVHLLREWGLGEPELTMELAFIPARAALLFGVDPVAAISAKVQADPGNTLLIQELAFAQELVADGSSAPWTFLSYAFLHGSWTHLLVNSVWLLAFGSPVARRFGAGGFLALFAMGAVGGSVAHLLTNLDSAFPMVGASGAVSAFMGAAIRFVFQPGAPLGIVRLDDDLAYRMPALPLSAALRDRRVVTFLAVWFIVNLATGLGATSLGITDSAIAWQAHVGGFLAGLLGFSLLDRRNRRV